MGFVRGYRSSGAPEGSLPASSSFKSMRRGIGVLVLIVLALATLAAVAAAKGDTTPPTITDPRWTPRYPIIPSNVTLSANVSDPDGVAFVQGTWCAVPPFLCTYPQLYHVGGNLYSANESTFIGSMGASFEGFAQDNAGNSITIGPFYALFVDSLSLTLTPRVVAATPGASVTVNGTAFYGPSTRPFDRQENHSAPAEGVVANVTVDGATHPATIDGTGNFSVTFAAPSSDGTYPIDVTAADRNLTG